MTDQQFDAISQLLRLQDRPSRVAARMVLVEGVKQVEAARITGLSKTGVSSICGRIERGLELARIAVGEST